jgi:hypothetical protein
VSKQKVCRRSVAYETNSGSSSPIVSVACAEKMRNATEPKSMVSVLRLSVALRVRFEQEEFDA